MFNGIAPVATYLKFSTFQSLAVVSQRPQIHVDLNRLIEGAAACVGSTLQEAGETV